MAQIFSPGAILGLKVALLGALAVGAAGVASLYHYVRAPAAVGEALRQPIPFSHKHHVGDDGIDCRYCHAGVERGAAAGMPATETCLTCHSQLYKEAPVLGALHESAGSGTPLRWARVHDLPDFVYFDHSIHVARGVACVECHGPVDTMPLTRLGASLEMQWCLACHRHPEPHVGAPQDVFGVRPAGSQREAEREAPGPLPSRRRLTDCSSCHR